MAYFMSASPTKFPVTISDAVGAQEYMEGQLDDYLGKRSRSKFSVFLLEVIDSVLTVVPYPVRRFFSIIFSINMVAPVFSSSNYGLIFLLLACPAVCGVTLFFVGGENEVVGRSVCLFLFVFNMTCTIWCSYFRASSPQEVKAFVSDFPMTAVHASFIANWASQGGIRRGDIRYAMVSRNNYLVILNYMFERFKKGEKQLVVVRPPYLFNYRFRAHLSDIAASIASSFRTPAALRKDVEGVLNTSPVLRAQMERRQLEDNTAEPVSSTASKPARL